MSRNTEPFVACCPTCHTEVTFGEHRHLAPSWLDVAWRPPDGPHGESELNYWDFCSWRCLAEYASSRAAEEVSHG